MVLLVDMVLPVDIVELVDMPAPDPLALRPAPVPEPEPPAPPVLLLFVVLLLPLPQPGARRATAAGLARKAINAARVR
jgi:hypothetical protein